MSEEKRILKNNQQVSYLIAQKKNPLRYKAIYDAGEVKFLLIGEGLSQAIDNFFANDPIPVQDYLSAFNTVRSIVTALKASSGE